MAATVCAVQTVHARCRREADPSAAAVPATESALAASMRPSAAAVVGKGALAYGNPSAAAAAVAVSVAAAAVAAAVQKHWEKQKRWNQIGLWSLLGDLRSTVPGLAQQN